MDFTVSGMYKNIRAYFGKMTKRKRFMLASIAALVLTGVIVLTKILDNSSYTVLYRGLSSSEGVEIVNMLESADVAYRLEDDGTILVPRDDEARIRMQLATSGFPNSTLGYDIFTSQADLMTTDYEKRQYLIFQLQDRLQEALKTLTGVKNAIVTLNVAAEDTYVLKSDKTESTAAVVLDLYTYAQLGTGQIRGIEELVAKSVPGLETENVIIVDSEGTILNDSSSDYSAGLADSQMELVDQINRLYEEKIMRFLAPVFGSDGMSVSVSVQMNFEQKNTEQTIYSPVVDDSGIISKQQTDLEQSTDGEQAGAAGTEENVGTPTYQEDDQAAQSTSSSETSSTEYLVNQLVQNVLDNGGQIQDMTVSMLINSDSLAPEALEQYREMVAYSVGIQSEKVYIASAAFIPESETPMITDLGTQTDFFPFTREVLLYAGAGLAALVLLLLVLLLRKRKKQVAAPPEPDEGKPEEGAEKAPIPDEIVLNETREQNLKRQVKEFAASNPETVAQLLRAWMKGDSR